MLCWREDHLLFNKTNTTGGTNGEGTAYHFGTPEFSGVVVAEYLVFVCGFVDYCLSVWLFFNGYCIFCPSIYGR